MTKEEYWQEWLECAEDEVGVSLTKKQSLHIAKSIQICRESINQAFYEPKSPYPGEIENLKKQPKKEKEKRGCSACRGKGYITENFGTRSSTSPCDECNGEGKV